MARGKGALEAHIMLGGIVLALGTLVPVALYQTGRLKRLPDPPGDIFDSERITKSKGACPMGIPDGIAGMGSFSITLALALAARRSRCRVTRGLLGAKLVADGSVAAFNVVRQVVQYRALCSWCTGTALGTAAACVAGRRFLKKTAR